MLIKVEVTRKKGKCQRVHVPKLPQQHCVHNAVCLQWLKAHQITFLQKNVPLLPHQRQGKQLPNLEIVFSCWQDNQESQAREHTTNNSIRDQKLVKVNNQGYGLVYLSVDMVHRDIKVTHGLPRMKVTSKNTVCTCFRDKVCDQFGCNRFTPLGLERKVTDKEKTMLNQPITNTVQCKFL